MTIDITPEAVERMINDLWDRMPASLARKIETMVRALSAALKASQAETAAAYESAATYLENPTHQGIRPAWGMDIRALTPADSKAALDRMIAEARAEGMREAAAIVWGSDNDVARWELDFLQDRILAAIPKGQDHE